MKYLKYFLSKFKKLIKGLLISFAPILFFFAFIIISLFLDGYTLEDFGFDGLTLNPFDYCNLTDIEYTAILHDDPNGKANVEITEYLTFDVHADFKWNTYKELWRELPEDIVDGLRVTYDVKSVSQILDNGNEIVYKETDKMYWEDYDYTKDSTYYWHHSDGSGRYPDNDESVLIYIPWTYRDKMTFKIVYSLNNAALKYNDCSELYLSMYSGNTIKKLKSYKGQILIPNDLMPSEYHAYTFGTKKSRIPFTESDSINPGYHTFRVALDKSDLKFDYHNRYIEFCLLAYGEDKHIFTQYAPKNRYSHENVLDECIAENEYYENENKKFNLYKTLLFITSIPISALVIITAKRKYNKVKEKYAFHEPEVNYEFFRDIPSDLDPIFASELVFMKDPFDENKEKGEEYAAILLSLMRKKYIQLNKLDSYLDWTNTNTIISVEPIETTCSTSTNITDSNYSPKPIYTTTHKITGEELEPLTTSERLYYDLINRHTNYNNTISIYKFQLKINEDYINTNFFVKLMESRPAIETGVMQGYFQSIDYKKPSTSLYTSAYISLVFGLGLIFGMNIISYFTPMSLCFGAYTILGLALIWKYFYLATKASNSVLFTQYGINEQSKWIGLYNFLNSNTLIHEKNIHDITLWEKYLIYATAFGISEKVINAIKIHAVELNIHSSPVLNSRSYIHSSRFKATSRFLGRSIHTSSRGGGFGGHGYGGGGRGGGGGGGGH